MAMVMVSAILLMVLMMKMTTLMILSMVSNMICLSIHVAV